jgi:DNA (cytosine-5)-methyltransferase 1
MKPVAFQPGNIRRQGGSNPSEDSFPTLSTDSGDQNPHIAIPPRTIRRLTPVECERLQGFPDNWSRIPYKGKSEEDCGDAPTFKVSYAARYQWKEYKPSCLKGLRKRK